MKLSFAITNMDLFVVISAIITSSTALKYIQGDYYRNHPSAVPKFLPVPMNVSVHEGETAHLRCRIYNLGPKTVLWRKTTEEFPLTVGKTVFSHQKNVEVEIEEVSDEETRYDLIIKNVCQNQTGMYECQISAKETYNINITLNVLDPVEHKPELTLDGTNYVSLMENIHLICNATGAAKAPNGVDWFFNGDPITASKPQWYGGRLQELNRKPSPGRSLISEIIIEKVTMEDQGHYVCRLSKTFAQVMKVHVLNDKKNHKEPKRDMKDEAYQSADSIQSQSEMSSAATRSDYKKAVLLLFALLFLDWR